MKRQPFTSTKLMYSAFLTILVLSLAGLPVLAQDMESEPDQVTLSVPIPQGPTDPQEMEAFLDGVFAAQMLQLIGCIFPDPGKGKIRRTRIMEAAAIAAYHQQTDFPIVKVLLCDDAPQYKLLIYLQALCWVHDGRNYKKLCPVVPVHREKLDKFRGKYWDYYQKLLQFGVFSSQEEAEALSAKFDQLFSTKTWYLALDERIAKSKAKKLELIMVLKHPELTLHNNDAELGARAQVRKRDVSLYTMTEDGTKANDTFLTIGQTAKKFGVSMYEYIYDRISKRFRLPSLAELIRAKSIPEKDYDMG